MLWAWGGQMPRRRAPGGRVPGPTLGRWGGQVPRAGAVRYQALGRPGGRCPVRHRGLERAPGGRRGRVGPAAVRRGRLDWARGRWAGQSPEQSGAGPLERSSARPDGADPSEQLSPGPTGPVAGPTGWPSHRSGRAPDRWGGSVTGAAGRRIAGAAERRADGADHPPDQPSPGPTGPPSPSSSPLQSPSRAPARPQPPHPAQRAPYSPRSLMILATWPVAFTLYRARSTLPSSSTITVERMTPVTTLPYSFFSP